MSALRWAALLVGALICGALGLDLLLSPGVVGGDSFIPSAILTGLGVVAIGAAFFAVWMQLFVGGKIGGRLLLLSALCAVGGWALLWAVFPALFG